MNRRFEFAFTLIELLFVISIVAMLATMFSPVLRTTLARAQSVACGNNLRQIGVAVQLYAQDHENKFPKIEPYPSKPVYSGDATAGSMLAVLGPYGVNERLLKCPSDKVYFPREGSSYMWDVRVDEELVSNPTIYTPHGQFNPRTSWLRISSDFAGYHRGRGNRLYADGHVRIY